MKILDRILTGILFEIAVCGATTEPTSRINGYFEGPIEQFNSNYQHDLSYSSFPQAAPLQYVQPSGRSTFPTNSNVQGALPPKESTSEINYQHGYYLNGFLHPVSFPQSHPPGVTSPKFQDIHHALQDWSGYQTPAAQVRSAVNPTSFSPQILPDIQSSANNRAEGQVEPHNGHLNQMQWTGSVELRNWYNSLSPFLNTGALRERENCLSQFSFPPTALQKPDATETQIRSELHNIFDSGSHSSGAQLEPVVNHASVYPQEPSMDHASVYPHEYVMNPVSDYQHEHVMNPVSVYTQNFQGFPSAGNSQVDMGVQPLQRAGNVESQGSLDDVLPRRLRRQKSRVSLSPYSISPDDANVVGEYHEPEIDQEYANAKGNKRMHSSIALNQHLSPSVPNHAVNHNHAYLSRASFHMKGPEWPKLGLDAEAFQPKGSMTGWVKKMNDMLQHIVSEKEGRMWAVEFDVRIIGNPLRWPNSEDSIEDSKKVTKGGSSQNPTPHTKRKYIGKMIKAFYHEGQDIWFKYLLQKTNIDFKKYQNQIRDLDWEEMFSVYLFYVHLIDEMVPRRVPTPGELEYHSAMDSAAKSFIKLANSHSKNSFSSENAQTRWLEKKLELQSAGKRPDSVLVGLWIFLGFWMQISRKSLLNELENLALCIDHRFKGIVNQVYIHSVDNLMDRLTRQMGLNVQ